MILHGDCLERLRELDDNSVDAVVTDPPYGLKFMGKKWDYDLPSKEIWMEVFRVLKPGAHLLSFGGTRTYHRMVVAIEDAGFDIRDQLQWLYGSGFPKSHDISKAIDKKFGAEREVIRTVEHHDIRNGSLVGKVGKVETQITAPATPEAYRYKGWGTALKPANEPIVLARKPLEKGLTVAENMLKWGVGGLNIDESRIEAADQLALEKNWENNDHGKIARDGGKLGAIDLRDRAPQGRWPANLLLDETAAQMLDEQSIAGGIHSPGKPRAAGSAKQTKTGENATSWDCGHSPNNGVRLDDGNKIGASRFFYVAKASKRERNAGLEFIDKPLTKHDARPADWENADWKSRGGNHHPTVKPIKLMEYLCKLITPPGGTILDPFCGSGSTGVAAFKNNFKFIGIEMNEEYVAIAKKRIECGRVSG